MKQKLFVKHLGSTFLFIVSLIFNIANADTTMDTTKQAVKDTAITTKVKTGLAKANFVGLTDLSVTTDHDVVFIAGCVQNPEDTITAENIAKNTSGVKKVISKITQKNYC